MTDALAGLTIRSATNHDITRIKTLVFNVLEEYGLTPAPETTDADLTDIENSYLQRGGVFDLVLSKSDLVATVGVYPVDDITCELRKMYIAPEIRGRGLGKLLLARALLYARQHGFKRMVLETSTKLPVAARLYQKYGFVKIHLAHPSPRADEAYALDL